MRVRDPPVHLRLTITLPWLVTENPSPPLTRVWEQVDLIISNHESEHASLYVEEADELMTLIRGSRAGTCADLMNGYLREREAMRARYQGRHDALDVRDNGRGLLRRARRAGRWGR